MAGVRLRRDVAAGVGRNIELIPVLEQIDDGQSGPASPADPAGPDDDGADE
jgi:hypothetical protein